MSNALYKLCADRHITLTPLRKEILTILYNKKMPIRAYDILSILKKSYPATEPPSVYRVLNFFIEKNLIHRIDSQNSYVYCASWMSGNSHIKQFYCFVRNATKLLNISIAIFMPFYLVFQIKKKIQIEDSLIELKGVCATCNMHSFSHP